jgi:hypothetical protein
MVDVDLVMFCDEDAIEVGCVGLLTDKGGELGEFLVLFTTSEREGVRRVSATKLILGGISTELLREREGVGGSVAEGRRR